MIKSGKRRDRVETKRWIVYLVGSILFFSSFATSVTADSVSAWDWKLPVVLGDEDIDVSFEVDSTWHLVKGKTSGNQGKIWIEGEDALAVNAEFVFPVNNFNTGGESRDERMREVMDIKNSPNVRLSIRGISPLCQAQEYLNQSVCNFNANAELSIREATRKLTLPLAVRSFKDAVEISGQVRFAWIDFGVEDPSILIAKLDPEVEVFYRIMVPRRTK